MSKPKLIILITLALIIITGFSRRHRIQQKQINQMPQPTTYIQASTEKQSQTIATTILKQNAGRPEYSPDGSQILYHQKGSDELYDVYVMDSQAQNPRCITCNYSQFQNRHAGNASWHPSGEYIAFQAEKESYFSHPGVKKLTHPGIGWHNDIWISNIQGTNFWKITNLSTKQNILDSTKFSAMLHPHFSPDGKQISWGESQNITIQGWQNWKLSLADFAIINNQPQITNQRSLTPQNQNQEYYESDDYNQDNNTLLISANLEPKQRAIGMDIYAFDLNTQSLTRLTDTLHDWDEAAVYSPDYSQIAWLSSTGHDFDATELGHWITHGKAEFWIMNADGTNKRQITFFNTPGTPDYQLVNGNRTIPAYIEWHPDGNSLIAGISIRQDSQFNDMIIKIQLNP